MGGHKELICIREPFETECPWCGTKLTRSGHVVGYEGPSPGNLFMSVRKNVG